MCVSRTVVALVTCCGWNRGRGIGQSREGLEKRAECRREGDEEEKREREGIWIGEGEGGA